MSTVISIPPHIQKKMNDDWRYSDDRMNIRTQALNILLNKYGSVLCSDGSPRYSNKSIYECVHDWVSQGNLRTDGIVKYYEAYYKDANVYYEANYD